VVAGPTADGFIADYLAEPEPSSSQLGNVVYSIALFRPQLLRPYADRLEQHVQRTLLSGAPNELVDAFLDVCTRHMTSRNWKHSP
jgi:hypothetical protein